MLKKVDQEKIGYLFLLILDCNMNILITGCGSGLGAALASAAEKVYSFEHNPNHIYRHYRTGGNALTDLCGDIAEWSFGERLSSYLRDNNIDTFINCAGRYSGEYLRDTSDASIDTLIKVNLTSQIKMIRRVYKYFLEKQKGLIININSLAGKYPSSGESIYCATKFGLSGFSKSLQMEAVGTGIEIMDVYSGGIQTKMTLGRSNYDSLMDVDEVAEQVIDLISDKKYYVNEVVLRKRNESSNS